MSVPCIPTGSFLLLDFLGRCLTVNITGGSVFSPVIAAQCTTLPQQTWSLQPVNHGAILVSGLSQGAGETVLLAEGSNEQAITSGNTGFGFNITCLPVGAHSVTLVDNLIGTEITLTSSQEGQSETAQVIFEPLNGSFEQIWTIVDLD
ncbi:hypothetical protein B0H16DRAFT_1570414 [Mycena metata]|uniref:Ricin B lectin domain-containing protein n=1 Tax=Mycena metata TaxID=1033252 RepID=A0AAD7MYA2_9AGAR|nr:hypothetical protein B0H16DRAFT_1570414 [Mycena metata]